MDDRICCNVVVNKKLDENQRPFRDASCGALSYNFINNRHATVTFPHIMPRGVLLTLVLGRPLIHFLCGAASSSYILPFARRYFIRSKATCEARVKPLITARINFELTLHAKKIRVGVRNNINLFNLHICTLYLYI